MADDPDVHAVVSYSGRSAELGDFGHDFYAGGNRVDRLVGLGLGAIAEVGHADAVAVEGHAAQGASEIDIGYRGGGVAAGLTSGGTVPAQIRRLQYRHRPACIRRCTLRLRGHQRSWPWTASRSTELYRG